MTDCGQRAPVRQDGGAERWSTRRLRGNSPSQHRRRGVHLSRSSRRRSRIPSPLTPVPIGAGSVEALPREHSISVDGVDRVVENGW